MIGTRLTEQRVEHVYDVALFGDLRGRLCGHLLELAESAADAAIAVGDPQKVKRAIEDVYTLIAESTAWAGRQKVALATVARLLRVRDRAYQSTLCTRAPRRARSRTTRRRRCAASRARPSDGDSGDGDGDNGLLARRPSRSRGPPRWLRP